MPTTCDDELVTPTHTGAQWQLRSILSQPEKGRDDVTIKICPLEPLGDSQLSDAQYAKAMSLKAEQVSKESKKLAEQEVSRAEKEASEAEKAASKAKKVASKAEAKLAPIKEAEKAIKEAEKAMRVAEAQVEATRADVYERACTRIDEPDYVQNRTRAAVWYIVGEDCDDDDVPLDLMGEVKAKVEDLREQEFNQTYHQLLNASNYHKLKSEAKFLTQTATSLKAGQHGRVAMAHTSVSELTKTAEEAKTKAEALAKVAEEAKAKVAELKSRSKDDDEDMSEESIRRPHRVTVICCCHACCCCVVCAGACARPRRRPARSLGGRPQCRNQLLCRVLERRAATPRVLERSGRLPYK